MNETPKLRLGFVGLGQAASWMFQQSAEIAKLPFTITAAAEPRASAREAFRRDFGGETFKSADELCRYPNVDVIYVATAPELHREHVITAVENGKHVLVEKPIALTIEDCLAMLGAADANGVKILAGHTHSFDAPIRKMREIVDSGRLGAVRMINSWNCNDFNPRPWPSAELASTHGPILNQGPHQIDIVRQIHGGPVRSVRASTVWDSLRSCEGGYSCFLDFEDGASGTMIYDARGFFDTAELFWWVGEGGYLRDPQTNIRARQNYKALATLGPAEREAAFEALKEQGRYGALKSDPSVLKAWGYHSAQDVKHQPFFGINLVHCENGAMRQSANGILIYSDDETTEIPLQHELRGRAAELMELYNGVVHNRPIFHDGRWGLATLEVCLALIESARTRSEIRLGHQILT
jgi:phthalate 4,5-cis-dihydrodiol dehydrogenase